MASMQAQHSFPCVHMSTTSFGQSFPIAHSTSFLTSLGAKHAGNLQLYSYVYTLWGCSAALVDSQLLFDVFSFWVHFTADINAWDLVIRWCQRKSCCKSPASTHSIGIKIKHNILEIFPLSTGKHKHRRWVHSSQLTPSFIVTYMVIALIQTNLVCASIRNMIPAQALVPQ